MTSIYQKETLEFTLKRVGLRTVLLTGVWLVLFSFGWVLVLGHEAQWSQLGFGVGAIILAMLVEVLRVHVFGRDPQQRLRDFLKR